MLNSEGVAEYWEEQTKKGDNPCHYHNKWQDRYALKMRTGAFRKSDLSHAKTVVDIGCGIGEYTREIAKLTGARIDAFDFPFNIEIAEKKNQHERITYHPHPLPHEEIHKFLRSADVAYTTTVYVHLAPDVRAILYTYLKDMKQGAKVMLLEYMPDVVPEFQRGLPHKDVETISEIAAKFKDAGFSLGEVRHVNFIDSKLFFLFGKHAITYALTMAIEHFLRFVGYKRSKYKMLIFVKD